MAISLTPKEKKKMISDIMGMQSRLWIEMHREAFEELDEYNSIDLFKYYKAHVLLKDNMK